MSQIYSDVPPTDVPPISGQVFFARSRPMMTAMRRTWWLFLVQGIVSIALGIAAIVWPEAAATVLVTFLGANLVLVGVVGIAMALRIKRSATTHR